MKIWWHFKISGITPGEAITVDIPDFEHKSFVFEPVYSYDHKTWHRMDDKTHPYTQVFTNETVWIAPNIPYDYSKSVELSTETRAASACQRRRLMPERGKPGC
ncbi:MAG: hypothetical protein IT422_02260 [Pirellulaceae bacterium]|nr:hypothetical protein [Pirellulaceae bacterium]